MRATTACPATRSSISWAIASALVDDVITEQHSEILISDRWLRLKHRVTQSESLVLSHLKDFRETHHLANSIQQVGLPRSLEISFEVRAGAEVVDQRVLTLSGNKNHLLNTGGNSLSDDVLDAGAVNDGQYLFRNILRDREEPGSTTCHGKDGCTYARVRHWRTQYERERRSSCSASVLQSMQCVATMRAMRRCSPISSPHATQ